MLTKCTKIPYFYRDASNYKASSEVIVSGVFTQEQKNIIQGKLDSGEFFIPTDVRMRALQNELISFPSEDDHVYHTLDVDELEVLDAIPPGCTLHCSADEFTARFKAVKDWDVSAEVERLGI
jgi:hypothetical protein